MMGWAAITYIALMQPIPRFTDHYLLPGGKKHKASTRHMGLVRDRPRHKRKHVVISDAAIREGRYKTALGTRRIAIL